MKPKFRIYYRYGKPHILAANLLASRIVPIYDINIIDDWYKNNGYNIDHLKLKERVV